MSQLAIDGGTPVRTRPLPTVGDISGRGFGEDEIANLTDVIKTGRLFRHGGKYVQQFEKGFAQKLGVKHGIACTSGTAAIHIALGAINPDCGREIITAPITDMGTVAPILFQNCIPVFADLDPVFYTMLPESIESKINEKTAAILVVHLFGQPCDMDPILAIARKHNLPVIEDCCQAYLTQYKGRLSGTMGDIAAFSLQQSKHMTAGDGGIVVTNDDSLAERASLFSDKGWPRTGDIRDYVFLGLNYRMNELTGAVAVAQMGKVESVVERRRAAADMLTRLLADAPGVIPPRVREGCKHSWWLYPLTIDENVVPVSPVDFARALAAEGIGAGHGYIGKPIYMSPALQEPATYGSSKCPYSCPRYGKELTYRPDDCPNTLEILRKMITIPCNEFFT
ncbi:MAG: DegT/DnrJ/EryC1/StrS family aminotransferase, partial [Armatimonadota bacterium]